MFRHWILTAVSVLALTLGVAACSGTGDQTQAGPTRAQPTALPGQCTTPTGTPTTCQ